ncbi:MAG TPA: hypothetical protein VGZ26_04620 [Pirellulales bacterium]|jgi:hypothetical protein|nr:hypothetical protein [Pirellulales bacterium]
MTCADPQFVLADCLAFFATTLTALKVVMEVAEGRPDVILAIHADEALTKIVTAWPHLTEPIRRAMLALVS